MWLDHENIAVFKVRTVYLRDAWLLQLIICRIFMPWIAPLCSLFVINPREPQERADFFEEGTKYLLCLLRKPVGWLLPYRAALPH